TNGVTYYIGVMPSDGVFWEHWDEGNTVQVAVYRHIDGGVEVTGDFDVDAIVHRVTEPPIYIATPTFVAAETAFVNSASSISVDAPAGIQQGDLLIAAISADVLSNTGIGLHNFERSEP